MALIDELRARLDPDCLQTDPDVIAAYAQDRAIFERAGTAAVVVMPRTTDDVVACLAAARAVGAPVVTRGAGTGLCGGANAVDECVILSMHRMNRVLHIDTANRMARVQPGVLNGELKQAVAGHGKAHKSAVQEMVRFTQATDDVSTEATAIPIGTRSIHASTSSVRVKPGAHSTMRGTAHIASQTVDSPPPAMNVMPGMLTA